MDTPVATPTTDGTRRALTTLVSPASRGVRGGLSVAIALGVFFGAMSCATSIAAGHGAHAAATDDGADHSASDHGRHGSSTADDAGGSSGHSDGRTDPSGAQEHPGMACVTSVQLRVPDFVAPTDACSTGTRSASAPPDGATGPEPPVPRSS